MKNKKHLVIEASPRDGYCLDFATRYMELLDKREHEVKLLRIKNLDIKPCSGCNLCLRKGEEYCPFYKDACADVIKAMEEADFITYFVPNFSLQVPGGLKTLFDRLAYVFHRPRMFGKCSSSFVVQGVYGGAKIVSYLREVMDAWGSNVVRGAVLKGGLKRSDISPSTCNTDRIMVKTIQQMEKKLLSNPYRIPTMFKLMIFRMTRSFMKFSEEATPVDRQYFQDQGWSDSEYFYPVRLSLFKKVLGKLFDKMAIKMCKKKSV